MHASVDFCSKTATADVQGGSALALVVQKTVRASVSPVSSREAFVMGQRLGETSHVVRVRWFSGLQMSWILRWGTRYFAIVGVRNIEEANRILEVNCVERTYQEVFL